ncbi:MAG: TonB-dependent receptor [Alphaproteobacteria bacterium]|nr:TonB-dependent receptor [Alphaproteobacteria bacterium]
MSSLFASLLAGTALAPLHAQVAQPAPAPPATLAPPAAAAATPSAATDTASPAPVPGKAGTRAAAPSDAAPDGEDNSEEEAIVVTGQRPRGSVVGDIQPEVQVSAREIRSYGVGSLSELLDALAPQTQSGRGRGGERPVILLNGRRISGFQEIRDIPPEAIERVDILPEEVALKYGYRADSKVVNFVLRRRFRALTTEVGYGTATEGGRSNYSGDINLLRIDQKGRWNFDAKYQQQDALFESDRDILQSAPSSPFDLAGNVGPAGVASEIDPGLSALVGTPVAVAGVPQSAASGRPTLGSFAGGANNANFTDLGRYRTLLPRSTDLNFNGTLNRTIFGNVSATLNATYEIAATQGAQGLPTLSLLVPRTNPYSPFSTDVNLYRYVATPNPLARDSNTQTSHLGLALNGDILPWRWSVTASYDRSSNQSLTGLGLDPSGIQAALNANDPTLNPFGAIPGGLIIARADDRATSTTQSGVVEAVANGPLFTLPGGKVSATLKMGGQISSFDSDSFRSGIGQSRHLSRSQANGQANFDVPITSRRTGFLSAVGDLSANFNIAVDQLSDFGTLTTIGYGFNWRPIPPLSIIGSVTHEQGAPTTQQLGNPTVLTPLVRVFDFVRGETVDISRIDGGNPALRSDNRRVTKLGINLRPFTNKDLTLNANYTRNLIRNPIASFPTATAEIEAAFPDRFTRDADGRLLRIDARPVNFEQSDREQLRWGINFSTPLGRAPEPPPGGGFRRRQGGEGGQGSAPMQLRNSQDQAQGQAGAPAQGQPGRTGLPGQGQPPAPGGGFFGRGPGGGGGGFGGRGGGGGRGGAFFAGARQARVQFAVYHTWHFRDEVLIRPGVPKLDFLNGSAAGSSGGTPRHEIEAQAGLFKNGFGARMTANWQSATRVNGGNAGATAGDLRFSSLTTANLRLFADLGLQPSLAKHPFFRGARVTLSVDNLFNSRVDVRDGTGTTPLSFQSGYLDPLGRSVRVTFRKLFF